MTTSSTAISVSKIPGILWRRKLWAIATFLCVFGTVAAVTVLMPRKYESRMKVLVKNERADMIISADRNGGSGSRNEVGEAQINSEIELLNGANLLQQVVLKAGLDRFENVNSSEASERRPVAIEKAVMRLQRNLKISPVRKANIIQVEYSSTDPKLSATVLRELAALYLEAHLKVHASAGTYAFFSGQAARYQDELKAAESKLNEFRRRESIVMLGDQQGRTLQKSLDADSEFMQADAAISAYTDRIADTRRKLSVTPQRVVTQRRSVPNQYSVERLHTMLAELQNRRTQMLAKFRPEDRMVLELDKEIADTQIALDKSTKMIGVEEAMDINPVYQTLEIELAKAQSELAGMEARRHVLSRQAGTYRAQLSRLGGATSLHDDLTRKQKEAEENYLLYAKKTEESRISESLDQQKIANVAIAEIPTESHVPARPNVPLYLTLGTLLATFLSFGVALAAEYFRDSVQEASEVEELTGLPVLATSYR